MPGENRRIDAHQHYWQLARSDYAWMGSHHRAIQRDFMPQDLQPLLDKFGIVGTVLVQADATARETDFLLEIANRTPSVLGVVGWVDFTAHSAVAEVERRAAVPAIRGLRPMLEFIDDPEWILQPQFDAVFRAMLRYGLCFDALIHPQHLKAIDILCRRYPNLPVVIDHGAKPKLALWRDDPNGFAAWKAGLAALARQPQVYCKLSGLLTEMGASWRAEDILPAIGVLLDIFGPQRLIWGTDWPVMTLAGRYEDWIDVTERVLANLSDDERDAIYHSNARRFYRLSD